LPLAVQKRLAKPWNRDRNFTPIEDFREMIVKAVEIRDIATFIPAIAIKMEPANEAQRYLMARVGFQAGGGGVILMRLTDQEVPLNPG
jgi:hypothetical protein